MQNLGFTDEQIENFRNDMNYCHFMLDVTSACNCFKEIKKHKKITISQLSRILWKYGYSINQFFDNENEQYENEPENNFYYDIDHLDGYIPGFSYKYIDKDKIELLGFYEDS